MGKTARELILGRMQSLAGGFGVLTYLGDIRTGSRDRPLPRLCLPKGATLAPLGTSLLYLLIPSISHKCSRHFCTAFALPQCSSRLFVDADCS